MRSTSEQILICSKPSSPRCTCIKTPLNLSKFVCAEAVSIGDFPSEQIYSEKVQFMNSLQLQVNDLDELVKESTSPDLDLVGDKLVLLSENDVDMKMLMLKLQDLSLNIHDLESQFTPVIELPEEEEEDPILSDPVLFEEEEESNDPDSILYQMETNPLLQSLLSNMDSIPTSHSDTIQLDTLLFDDDINGDPCQHISRDLSSVTPVDKVHAIFDNVDDDYSIDCLFGVTSDRADNIDDDTWCDAQFYANQVDSPPADVFDPEIYELIGSQIECVELSAFVEYL